MKRYKHPGHINSSWIIIYLAFAAVVSYWLTLPFYNYNRAIAWAVILIGAIYFGVVFKLLKQFEDTNHLFAYFLMAVIVFPNILGFSLNALIGVLAEGSAPILYTPTGVIPKVGIVGKYPSVLIHYGLHAFAWSMLFAFVAERFYEAVKNFMPTGIRKALFRIDRTIDKSSASASDSLFFLTSKGLILCSGVSILYGVINAFLLRL